MSKDEEIQQLKESLSVLRNTALRMCCKLPNGEEVVHIKRSDWNRAFISLIAPPYNRLRWENET